MPAGTSRNRGHQIYQHKKIGLIGAGAIGQSLLRAIAAMPEVEVAFVLVRDAGKLEGLDVDPELVVTDPAAASERDADLVLEAATPALVAALAAGWLKRADFCAFSCSALADAETDRAVRAAAAQSGRRFFVPHGAILGLDGIADGRDLIERVTITTTKSGKSLGLDPETEGVVFEGSVREACRLFPRNVNVHAAIALAGIGFDQTTSRIVAEPGLATNQHRIEVTGEGFDWDLGVSSRSLGGVTGSYTPLSAVGSLRRILGGTGVALV